MMASTVLRSAGCTLRRSMPQRFYPLHKFQQPLMDNSRRLFSSDSSGSTQPDKQHLPSLSDTAARVEMLEYEKCWEEKKKMYRFIFKYFDKRNDVFEELHSNIQVIKDYLETANKRDAQKLDRANQLTLLFSCSSIFVLALYNLHVFG